MTLVARATAAKVKFSDMVSSRIKARICFGRAAFLRRYTKLSSREHPLLLNPLISVKVPIPKLWQDSAEGFGCMSLTFRVRHRQKLSGESQRRAPPSYRR